jgi:transcriptional regulator with XRE-family HTH domain
VFSDFPEKLPAKLKAIRERYDLTLAEPLKSLDAATIEAYENGEADLPVSVLFAYAKLAGIPVENLLDDDRDVWFAHRVN